jgi:cysteine-rich repeat protein
VVRIRAVHHLLVVLVLAAQLAHASPLAESIDTSGDSITRGFDANTSSCNYDDNVSRNWATGVDHGSLFCSSGGTTFSHAERLECAKGGPVTNFNDAESGADMLNDFATQAQIIKLNLSSSPAPRYVPVFMGHNDICTNTTSRTGNSCSGDEDPNNYCRTTNAAFEREFRRGMDQLIQIPSVRIGVSAIVRVSELCNFGSKSACGLAGLGSCNTVWGLFPICQSLTDDCSNQRRIDAYNTAVGYNEILERVTAEYAAIPIGGPSATGAVKAPDVRIRYSEGAFFYKFSSGDVSCCDCFHPSDQGQSKIAQFGWDGLQCSASSQCCGTSGDPLTDARCDVVDTTSFYPSGFWPGGMPCGNGIVDPGEQCDDGNTVDGDCCSSTCQFEAAGAPCAADTNLCTNDVCNGAGACTHPNNTDPCDDGLFCTVNDACSGGSCTGTPRNCSSAGDQCNASVCDEASDACVAQPRPNGTACADGNACTQTDTCVNGTCTGGNPVVCTAQDACHVAGTCNPLSGTCSNPVAPDGTACNDGDACTQTDTCHAGTCTGANPVACTAQDQCHAAGTCNPSTGACSNPPATNGTPCSDGNACTQVDTCQGGACTGTNPVTCAAQDQCHVAGTCNPATGICSNPAKANGSSCDDGDLCTQGDTCQAGSCTAGAPLTCTASDQCHVPGTCNPSIGACTNPPKPNGAACSDGSACTAGDACQGGVCFPGTPVICVAQDQCHLAGTCNPATGVCSNPSQPNGAPCSDGNACTQVDTCQSGTCTGTHPVTCVAQDQCHAVGTCNPSTGVCSNPAKPDGAACNDGNACTQTDACAAGACVGSNAVGCSALDQCHLAGTCNPATGACSNPSKPDGATCDDGNACTQTDACAAGACSGSDPVVCDPGDACHEPGVCNPATGTCTTTTHPDGSACDDGNACTSGDVCTGGACAGHSACGDGVVQTGCGEACDDGTGNGVDGCCSTACTLVDGDGDGLCDAVDPCTGGVPLTDTLVKIGRQTTPPGDDTVAWKGRLTLPVPFSPPLDPSTRGVRIVFAYDTSAALDVTIPGGALAGSPPVGWRNLAGVRWLYVDKSAAPAGGITKVQIKQRPSLPGLLEFRVKGKRASIPPVPGNPPLAAILVLDPPTASTGQCGESVLACTFNGSASSRRCQ